jgi:hypothetical protein
LLPQITICRWTKGCWALLTLSLLTLVQRNGLSQPTDPTAFSLVRLEPSARIAALAGAAQSIGRDDPSIVFLNPAVASPEMHRMLSVSYANHLADINAAFLSYVTSVGGAGTVVGGLRYLSYGSFERADANGFRDGTTFTSYESVLTAGLSRSAGQLQYGGTLNLLLSGIDGTTASAFAVDAGVFYYKASQQLGLSASAHNVGWVMSSFGQQKDELPFDLRVGASKRLTHLPFMLSLTGYNLHDWDGPDSFGSNLLKHLAFGGEFYLGQAVRLRVGYNHRRHDELKTGSRIDLAGVGLGFGVHITRFRFDYAYNDWSSLGGVHHLTIQTRL